MIDRILNIVSLSIILRSLLFGGIATAIVCLLRCAFVLPASRHKLWETAGKAGNCVTAVLHKTRYVSDSPHGKGSTWLCTYHYNCRGKRYRYECYQNDHSRIPQELSLRFLRYPWNAHPQESFTGFEWDFPLCWFPVLTLLSLALIILASL